MSGLYVNENGERVPPPDYDHEDVWRPVCKTRINISFRHDQPPNSQGPYLMVIREFWENGEVVHADVIKSFDNESDVKSFDFDEIV